MYDVHSHFLGITTVLEEIISIVAAILESKYPFEEKVGVTLLEKESLAEAVAQILIEALFPTACMETYQYKQF